MFPHQGFVFSHFCFTPIMDSVTPWFLILINVSHGFFLICVFALFYHNYGFGDSMMSDSYKNVSHGFVLVCVFVFCCLPQSLIRWLHEIEELNAPALERSTADFLCMNRRCDAREFPHVLLVFERPPASRISTSGVGVLADVKHGVQLGPHLPSIHKSICIDLGKGLTPMQKHTRGCR